MAIKRVAPKLVEIDKDAYKNEMSKNETSFLLEMIRKYTPKRILEIGCSGGGHLLLF